MCLIVFAWQVVPGVPLIAAANRDEFYARDAAPAAPWPDQPRIFAGRDLKAGGSWMGVAHHGDGDAGPSRFAAITNIRAPHEHKEDAPSRGHLVADYLAGTLSPQAYIDSIRDTASAFNGFNLVVGDRDSLVWFSNCRSTQRLAAGTGHLWPVQRLARFAVAEGIKNQGAIRQPAVPGRT